MPCCSHTVAKPGVDLGDEVGCPRFGQFRFCQQVQISEEKDLRPQVDDRGNCE